MFQLVVFSHDGTRFDPGELKVGEFGLQPGTVRDRATGVRSPELDDEFDALDERFFSLVMNENYYETINQLPDDLRRAVLPQRQPGASSNNL